MAEALKCARCNTKIVLTPIWRTKCRCGTIECVGSRIISNDYEAVILEAPSDR